MPAIDSVLHTLKSRRHHLRESGGFAAWRQLKLDAALALRRAAPADRAALHEVLGLIDDDITALARGEPLPSDSTRAVGPLVLVTSGQTGVERGAVRAAAMTDTPVVGICTREARDELTSLPPEIANHLQPARAGGVRFAAVQNLALATAVIIAVPEVAAVKSISNLATLDRTARAKDLPVEIVDPSADLSGLLARFRGPPHLVYITGPRATRWAQGQELGFKIVVELHDG